MITTTLHPYPQLKHFEASIREALSKLSDSEPTETDDLLVSKIEDLVKSHIETTTNLEKRDEELAASRKSLSPFLRTL